MSEEEAEAQESEAEGEIEEEEASEEEAAPDPPPPAMRKCPYCAEEIRAEAVKCRFCKEFLREYLLREEKKKEEEEEPPPEPEPEPEPQPSLAARAVPVIIVSLFIALIAFSLLRSTSREVSSKRRGPSGTYYEDLAQKRR